MPVSIETNAEKKATPERLKKKMMQALELYSISKILCFHPDQIRKIPYF
ncbi:hypothetical protein LEP1GSC158_1751 [Leptospira interrogans serovar Zanoni str. LT2156]|uniref:Uncharacterized protein n=1 Tax=Leptospira interrogans serovar Zanoni str. LT2156 TaxID=1001601 RepID=M6HIP9_LEPIR|nr:hypothetical protein LEP1GSC158_1751 [Leptospira interrogans serovar Zanoni str. LT2156]